MKRHASGSRQVGDCSPWHAVRRRREVRREESRKLAAPEPSAGHSEAKLGKVHCHEGPGKNARHTDRQAQVARIGARGRQRPSRDDEPEAERTMKRERRENDDGLEERQERRSIDDPDDPDERVVAPHG